VAGSTGAVAASAYVGHSRLCPSLLRLWGSLYYAGACRCACCDQLWLCMPVFMQALGVAPWGWAPGGPPGGGPAQLRPSCMRLGVAFVGSMFLCCGVHAVVSFVAVQEGCSDGDLQWSLGYGVQGLRNAS